MKKILQVFVASLATTAAFANLPYYPIEFPRDEGAHYANVPYKADYMVEWWYFNGRLKTDEGKTFGYSTAMLVRSHKVDGKVVVKPTLHMHVTDVDDKQFYAIEKEYANEKFAFSTSDLNIDIGDKYSLKKEIVNGETIHHLKINEKDDSASIAYDFTLKEISKPSLIHGTGLVPMSLTTNSYYYMSPRFELTGTMTLNGKTYHITKPGSDGWLERQWGDFDSPPTGWEWYSVRFDNGLIASIITGVYRPTHKVITGFAHIIYPDGETKEIPYSQMSVKRNTYWHNPHDNIDYPIDISFDIPGIDLQLRNTALFPEQEKLGYWEGFSNISARYQGKPLNAYAYTELMI